MIFMQRCTTSVFSAALDNIRKLKADAVSDGSAAVLDECYAELQVK